MTPRKKRPLRSVKPRTVDPARVAVAALERIKTILIQSGHRARIREPVTAEERAARSELFGRQLPPSYAAIMDSASGIGDPEVFLGCREMREQAAKIRAVGGDEAGRYIPFCAVANGLICFDVGADSRTKSARHDTAEPPVVLWERGTSSPIAANFGEWLDGVADAREDAVANAAKLPQNLKRLLHELGFQFDYPVVGHLETGDIDAVVGLIGIELANQVRGDVDRLFDSSGKASLTLNIDEFILTVNLRTGAYAFTAEHVFRWLRQFRDENFFGEPATPSPTTDGNVRDLRTASREPPLVKQGRTVVRILPATRHVFHSAAGPSLSDFFILGRPLAPQGDVVRRVFHVCDDRIQAVHDLTENVERLHVTRDGSIWGLASTRVVRIADGERRSFPLKRTTPGTAAWYGIGGNGERVFVWGAGNLLVFDGQAFVPFEPDAALEPHETVVSLVSHGHRISMLVTKDRIGAVARFDSAQWEPITEDQVIEGFLCDLDIWRSVAYVLSTDGVVWNVDQAKPRPLNLAIHHPAFQADSGSARAFHSVRAYDGGILLASTGGTLSAGLEGTLFHALPAGSEPVHLSRVGILASSGVPTGGIGIVALCGPNAWTWQEGEFRPIDTRNL